MSQVCFLFVVWSCVSVNLVVTSREAVRRATSFDFFLFCIFEVQARIHFFVYSVDEESMVEYIEY